MKRKRLSKRTSNYSFARNKFKVKNLNRTHTAYRGGIRL